jgi:trans-aconitate methyltransferase
LTADLLPRPQKGARIADLGCGTGRLAKLLVAKGYPNIWGVDFSMERVVEARRYVPEASFECGDLFDPSIQSRYQDFQAFVILEVLEHISSDLSLLEALPKDAMVVASVPNYDSAGHVRVFPEISDVHDRYGELLDINAMGVLPRNREGRFIYVMRGIRR